MARKNLIEPCQSLLIQANGQCTNGSIDASAMNLARMGEQTPRRVRGRLNSGGTPIELSTVNGNILVEPRP